MHVSNTQILKPDARWCIVPSLTKFFLSLISESYIGKLVEEVEVNDQISAEKRQKSERKDVSCFSFLCAFKSFLLSADLENQYGYCLFFFVFCVI